MIAKLAGPARVTAAEGDGGWLSTAALVAGVSGILLKRAQPPS